MKLSTIFLISIFSLTMLSAYSGIDTDSGADPLNENEGEWCGVQGVYDLLQATHHLFKVDQADKNNNLFQDVIQSDDYEDVTEATKKLFESKEKIAFLITSLSQRGNEDNKADSSYINTRKQVNKYLGKNAPKKDEVKKAEKIIISLASFFVPCQEVKGYDKGKPYSESYLDSDYVHERLSGCFFELTKNGSRFGDKLPQWLQEKIANGCVNGWDRLGNSSVVSFVSSSSKKIPAYIASKNPFSSSEDTLGDEKVSRQTEVESKFYADGGKDPLLAFTLLNSLIESMEKAGVNFELTE